MDKRGAHVLLAMSQHIQEEEASKPECVDYYRKWQIGRLKISFHYKSANRFWGRFGGGWQWALGFRSGGNTLLIDLLICSVSCSIVRCPAPKGEGEKERE